MRIRKCLPVIFIITVLMAKVSATEFRSPLIVERGPMRYVFEEWDKKHYDLKLWAAGYSKDAYDAFLSHGTSTKPLSALFFNKSDFYVNEIFPNSYADINTEYYSPYLAVTKLSPRITYEEKGISLGFRVAYPVYKDKGRVGLRAQVPFKKIEIERKDIGDKDTNQLDDLLTKEVVTRTSINGAGSEAKDVVARAVRVDFLQSIPYTANGKPLLDIDSTTGRVSIVGEDGTHWTGIVPVTNRMAVIVQSAEGQIPRKPDRNLGINENAGAATVTPTPLMLPTTGVASDQTKQFQFERDGANNYTKNYSALDMHAGTIAQKLDAQSKSAQLWLTTVHKEASEGAGGGTYSTLSTGATKLWSALDALLESYQGNVYEWLLDRGYVFDSSMRKGFGDIDLDLFYEHQFDDDIAAEFMLGIRFPTGISSNYCGNPYKAQLGNGEHFELKLGGMVAWQPLYWMNIKLDARYVFVLKAEEKRCAAFCGANIKNIGPCVSADVDWNYFVGQLDFNLFHPKTDAISFLLGYEFYYKTTDHIRFKCNSMQSWLGRKWDPATSSWLDNKQQLSSAVAERNSEAISHKVRMEVSARISKWFELYFGGSYAFAGEHAPRECDLHCGSLITF